MPYFVAYCLISPELSGMLSATRVCGYPCLEKISFRPQITTLLVLLLSLRLQYTLNNNQSPQRSFDFCIQADQMQLFATVKVALLKFALVLWVAYSNISCIFDNETPSLQYAWSCQAKILSSGH